ncbi:uncharacterized protein [Scyliorhinus torazame]|uniref:uncharacterized protein n=1 Tax=Scyliorhinus torazame TaxID=75743 RepID=UPI003B5C4431
MAAARDKGELQELEQREGPGKKDRMAAARDKVELQEFIRHCFEEHREEMRKEMLAPMLSAIEGLGITQKAHEVPIQEMQKRVSQNEDEISDLAVRVEQNEALHRRWAGRLEDLENRSRRKNLRILGLPEGAEGADAGAYASTMLGAMMGKEAPSRPLELDGAHRVLARRPRANEPPRVMVVRFHRFTDREWVLKWAKKERSRGEKAVNLIWDEISSISTGFLFIL